MKKGFVALVGAGPGDAGLLTRKGADLLRQADVVLYDRLVSPEILREIPPTARRIDVGKQAGHHSVPQPEINEILLQESLQGNFVVRLKGGDPFVFGRGGEELEALVRHGIPFTVVPGVTSAVAAACYAGIPVTHRDSCSSFHVITGHPKKGGSLSIDYSALCRLGGTIVFLMGVSALSELMNGLLDAGMNPDTPAAAVENGTRPEQRKLIATVGTLAQRAKKATLSSPAVIIVGEVCAYSDEFDWFQALPLRGKRLVVTRPDVHEDSLTEQLLRRGAMVSSYPCIAIQRLLVEPSVFQRLSHYQWLLFTSQNGVQVFFDQLFAAGKDVRSLGTLKIGAVGLQTAQALRKFGICADCVPDRGDGIHLAQLVAAQRQPGERILVPGPEKPSGSLEQFLPDVEYLPLYQTVLRTDPPDDPDHILSADGVVFTSPSAVNGFAQTMPSEQLSAVRAFCIGNPTAAAAASCGMNPIIAHKPIISELVHAIEAHWK